MFFGISRTAPHFHLHLKVSNVPGVHGISHLSNEDLNHQIRTEDYFQNFKFDAYMYVHLHCAAHHILFNYFEYVNIVQIIVCNYNERIIVSL